MPPRNSAGIDINQPAAVHRELADRVESKPVIAKARADTPRSEDVIELLALAGTDSIPMLTRIVSWPSRHRFQVQPHDLGWHLRLPNTGEALGVELLLRLQPQRSTSSMGINLAAMVMTGNGVDPTIAPVGSPSGPFGTESARHRRSLVSRRNPCRFQRRGIQKGSSLACPARRLPAEHDQWPIRHDRIELGTRRRSLLQKLGFSPAAGHIDSSIPRRRRGSTSNPLGQL